jgi:hypothetical protein
LEKKQFKRILNLQPYILVTKSDGAVQTGDEIDLTPPEKPYLPLERV